MSKLSRVERAARKSMKNALRDCGGVMFSDPEFRVTVVVRPAMLPPLRNNASMTHCVASVALCSEHDEFKRKRGELIALNRMFSAGSQPFPVRVGCGQTLAEVAGRLACFLA